MPNSRASEHEHEQVPEPVAGPTPGAASSTVSSEQAQQPPAGAEQELARAREELARMEERYKRALADLDNYRKRSERETERRVADAREALERDWLEALDSVERALRMTPDDQGLQAVLAQMETILHRHGATRLGAAGERFDPALHEAVDVRASGSVADRTILEVARSGFALGDRVLRPAQVIVSRQPQAGG